MGESQNSLAQSPLSPLKKKIELKLGMKCSVKNAAGWSLKIAKDLCVIHTPRFFVRCVILGSFFFFYISTTGSVCVFMFGRAGRRVLILAEQSAQEGGEGEVSVQVVA